MSYPCKWKTQTFAKKHGKLAGLMMDALKSELKKVNLGDCRLERRLRSVAEDLSRQPEYPINVASSDAASTKAAYRLFDNERVTADKILSCHRKKTLSRMQHEPVVLAIQDLSYFNLTNHKKTRGLGPTGCTALWCGWQRLASMTELYESMVNKCGK